MDDSNPPAAFDENLLSYPPDNNTKEEFDITHDELNQIKDAIKDENFRKLLSDYVQEVRDPNNQLTYQTEMTQLEKERGNIVHFINPVSGFVLKTSVDGKMKAFINICSNPLIKGPTFETVTQDNKTGNLWSIPYSQSQGRDDMDKSGKTCTVYDVIFNPETLKMSKQNKILQQKLEETAIEAVEKSFGVVLDKNNVRKPKLRYKGMKIASTIKYKIGTSLPDCVDPNQVGKELPPQPDELNYTKKDGNTKPKEKNIEENGDGNHINNNNNEKLVKTDSAVTQLIHDSKNCSVSNKNEIPTVPTYNIKYRSHIDMQDYCINDQREGRSNKPIPDEIILSVDLPLLRNSTTMTADVIEDGWYFELNSTKTAIYKLKLKLPFQVHQDVGKAVFDKDKRKLCITLKTIEKKFDFIFPTMESESTHDDQVEEEYLNDGNIVEQEHEQEQEQEQQIDSINNLLLNRMKLKDDSPQDDSLDLQNTTGSPNTKKSVSFSDVVQKQLYRSNSSILGQKKKNQRKAKNKKKQRERLNSGESISSMDEDNNDSSSTRRVETKTRERICSGGSLSSMDDENDLDGKSCSENDE